MNASPEPFSNVGLSLLGDLTVPAALWLAVEQPWLFFAFLAVALVVMVVLLRLLWRFARRLLSRGRPASTGA